MYFFTDACLRPPIAGGVVVVVVVVPAVNLACCPCCRGALAVASASGLCPLLSWSHSGNVLAILYFGLDAVTLWRRDARDIIRVGMEQLPTSVWWSADDTEVGHLSVHTPRVVLSAVPSVVSTCACCTLVACCAAVVERVWGVIVGATP